MGEWPDSRVFERQALAARYGDYLQGLRFVPFGMLFIYDAGGKAGWWAENYPAALVAAFVVAGIFQGYYWLSFKEMPDERRSSLLRELLDFGKFLLLIAVVSVVVGLDVFMQPPVSLTGLLLAAGVVVWWRMGGAFRWHYGVMAGLLVVASVVLPLAGLTSFELVAGPFLEVVMGGYMILGGVIDHWLLRSFTKSLSEVEN